MTEHRPLNIDIHLNPPPHSTTIIGKKSTIHPPGLAWRRSIDLPTVSAAGGIVGGYGTRANTVWVPFRASLHHGRKTSARSPYKRMYFLFGE
jgi:hypothetical protein